MITWTLDSLEQVGGLTPRIVGAPGLCASPYGPAVVFNGKTDALFFDVNPLQNARAFTLEALFRPDSDGAPEQRFVHIQDSTHDARVLLETRLAEGRWYADTFIKDGPTEQVLGSPALTHPAGEWQTLALVYDGHTMSQYVNGEEEHSGKLDRQPIVRGRVSIGCRINEVFWFKGAIRSVRFTPSALPRHLLLIPSLRRES